MLLLLDLLHHLDPSITLPKSQNLPVSGVEEDSRRVQPGNVFIARAGTKTQGTQFVAEAAARGAIAVVTETKLAECKLPQIVTKDAARATSILAHAFYGEPSNTVKVFGVTGTNGKTTIT